MTIQELCQLSEVEPIANRKLVHSANAKVVVGHRRKNIMGYIRPGARIDLTCEVCGQQIVLGPISVRMVEQEGKRHVCRNCFAQAADVDPEDLPDIPGAGYTENAQTSEQGAAMRTTDKT